MKKQSTENLTREAMVKKVLQERQIWVFRFTTDTNTTQFIGPFRDSMNMLAKVIHERLTDDAAQSFKLEAYHGEYACEFLLLNPPEITTQGTDAN